MVMKLKIALQRSGRLAEGSTELLRRCGIRFSNGMGKLRTEAADFPLEIFFLRDDDIPESEAVLIARRKLDAERSAILDKLVFRIRSVNAASRNKYILLNAPREKIEEITAILPGMKSPTVVPLAEEGWVSVHSVIGEQDFWEVVDNLKKAGAEGILILSIDQMIR